MTMRHNVENKEPKKFNHLGRNFDILKKEKQRLIDRGNHKLLSKIMAVMSRSQNRSSIQGTSLHDASYQTSTI